MLTRCRTIEIDARNNLGFTPLMKAALQGRNKCAKILLFAGNDLIYYLFFEIIAVSFLTFFLYLIIKV